VHQYIAIPLIGQSTHAVAARTQNVKDEWSKPSRRKDAREREKRKMAYAEMAKAMEWE